MPETLKIAFVGTSCVGKTTLLNTCQERLADPIIVVDEAAREWFTQHREVTDRFGVHAQGEVQALALRKEQQAQARDASGHSVILCDRSVLDAPAYVFAHGDERGADELLSRVRPWLSTYHKIYVLDPADVPYETDAIRDEAETVRHRIHRAFFTFFDRHQIPYELLTGDVDSRFHRVERLIAQLRGNSEIQPESSSISSAG